MRRKRLSFSALAVAFLLSTISANADIYYKVRSGDTLWRLASRYSTTPKRIAHANGMREDANLRIGKTICIPTSKATSGINRASRIERGAGAAVHTTRNSVCLRKGPGTNFGKIAVLQENTSAKVICRKGSWTKVSLSDGTCGYLYSPLIAAGPGSVQFSRSAENSGTVQAEQSLPDNSRLVRTALACRGMPYRRGGTRGAFDCSGFTRYVFAKYGVNLPHSSAAQSRLGTPVAKSELREGDLVFFSTYRRGISHVGIYTGENRFVHAATYGRGVRVDSLSSGYYASRYRWARRVK